MIHFAKRMLETAWYLIVILGFLTMVDHYAHASDTIVLDSIAIDVLQFTPESHDPMINYNGVPDRNIDKGLNFHINTTILRYIYWNSMVWSLTDKPKYAGGAQAQFRTVGLEMSFGIRLTEHIDIGYYHFSKHELDTTGVFEYPLLDAIQLTIKIYDAHKQPDTLF